MVAAAALALGACQGVRPTQLPHDAAAYDVVPAPPPGSALPAVRVLQPGDSVAVQVFREPDLGADKAVIDELGMIQLPLLGEVAAAGNTPVQLSRLIGDRLGERYLRDPRVTVALVTPAAQTVAVEGQVSSPGVYPVTGNETLLTTLARAGSPTQLAKLNEVVVFRTINQQRAGAVFNLEQIRAGRAADPQIVHGDTVVVGFSQIKGTFRDFLSVSPLINLFTVF